MEDKRPVVENNLLSGKQYVAGEPPISDTSDTEGKPKPHLAPTIIIAYAKHVSASRTNLNSIDSAIFRFFVHLSTALDSDSRYPSNEEQNRELTRSISREVAKLSEQWNQLIDHSDNWKHSLDEYMTVGCDFVPYLKRSMSISHDDINAVFVQLKIA